MREEFEVIEEYLIGKRKRYRIHHKPSSLILNVEAETLEKAMLKAKKILEKTLG